MRYFRHVIAENPCSRHCGYCRSDIETSVGPFHLIMVVVAAVALGIFLICKGFPWYYMVGMLAGEFFMLFVSGMLSMFLSVPVILIRRVVSCPKCGAPLTFAGRHFDPLGSRLPHWSDILISVVFVALNVALWVFWV